MPFWADHAWDHEYGGFLTRLDRQGRRLEDHEKILMMQVRMIASLSWAHLHGLNDRGYLDLATRGFEFLERHFWDHANGGHHFSVTRDGRPLSTRKNTDFHAYALTGLVAFHEASGREDARRAAERVFEVLKTQAADPPFGFLEDFDGQPWEALNAEQMHLSGNGLKTIDMHTNVLEGYMYLARVTREARHLEALEEVLLLILKRGLQSEGCTITAFDQAWNPLPDGQGRFTTSYGLNVELAWLLLEAAEVLGRHAVECEKAAVRLVDHALAFGFDQERGGLAAYGPVSGSTVEASELDEDRLLRPWWTQAEMMNALLALHAKTSETKYLEAFVKLWRWIWRHQIDHEFGDWYQDVTWPHGVPTTTDKGNEFKTAFHVSRALIRGVEGLEALRRHQETSP